MFKLVHIVVFGCLLIIAACTPAPQYLNANITASNLHSEIAVRTQNGDTLQLNAPQKGKVTALFFGYTQCPDVCPTTLGKMKVVLQQLGADAAKVRVVFVTIDPERDTPALLKEYMAAFNPSGQYTLIGAFTDPVHTRELAQQFQVVFEKVGSGANYTVNHTANLFLLDENGRAVVSVPYEAKPEAIVHDIRQILAQYH